MWIRKLDRGWDAAIASASVVAAAIESTSMVTAAIASASVARCRHRVTAAIASTSRFVRSPPVRRHRIYLRCVATSVVAAAIASISVVAAIASTSVHYLAAGSVREGHTRQSGQVQPSY